MAVDRWHIQPVSVLTLIKCNFFFLLKLLFYKKSFDDDRIKEIGPNLACAEWLMKNGAQVRWKGSKEFVSHYDCLPKITPSHLKQFLIEEVYAGKEASISHIGFYYFSRFLINCNNSIYFWMLLMISKMLILQKTVKIFLTWNLLDVTQLIMKH